MQTDNYNEEYLFTNNYFLKVNTFVFPLGHNIKEPKIEREGSTTWAIYFVYNVFCSGKAGHVICCFKTVC